jgi:hypothetical protein
MTDPTQDPAELDAVNQPEEQVDGDSQQSPETGTEPSYEEKIAQLVKEKGLDGRWGERAGLELVDAALESYRHMERFVGQQQNRLTQQQSQQLPDQTGQAQPQTPNEEILDRLVADPQGTMAQMTQQQVAAVVPQLIDKALADNYVNENPDIMANAPQIDLIMRRNALPYSYGNVKFAHEVFVGKRHDPFSSGQQTYQQGVQQGQTIAQQRQSAQVETGSHRPVPQGPQGKEDALKALLDKFGGVGNVPQEEMDKIFPPPDE